MTTDGQVRLRIVGQWADAWLYKDHILLWGRANQLYVAKIDRLLHVVSQTYGPEAATIVEYSLFRNDWKQGSAFKSLARVRGLREALLAAYRNLPQVLVIAGEALGLASVPTQPAGGTLVDSVVYANRVFLASNEGLFQSYIDPRRPDRLYPQAQILDFPVHSVRAKYMSVNASAVERGLWFKPIEFGESGGFAGKERPQEIDDYSEKAHFVYRDLLTYRSDATPHLLKADAARERPHERAEFEDWRVNGYSDPVDMDDVLLPDVARELSIGADEKSDLRVLGNSYRQLLVERNELLYVTALGHLEARDDSRPRRRHPTPRPADFRGVVILETYPVGQGFFVETLRDVRYVDRQGVRIVHDGAVARVRTFKDSRRYQEVGAIVHETGCDVIGWLPEAVSSLFAPEGDPPPF